MVEREAVSRAIALAEIVDCPIQIFHVTAAEVAEEVARAQARGLKVWGETCTPVDICWCIQFYLFPFIFYRVDVSLRV